MDFAADDDGFSETDVSVDAVCDTEGNIVSEAREEVDGRGDVDGSSDTLGLPVCETELRFEMVAVFVEDAADEGVGVPDREVDAEPVDDGELLTDSTGDALCRAERLFDVDTKGDRLSAALAVELGVSTEDGDGAILDAYADGVGVDGTVSDELPETEGVEDVEGVGDTLPLIDEEVRGEREGDTVVFAELVNRGDTLANDALIDRVVFAEELALTDGVPLVLERGLRLPEGLNVEDVESFGVCDREIVDTGLAEDVVLWDGGTLKDAGTDRVTDDVDEAVLVGDGESTAESEGCRFDGDVVDD